MHGFDNAYNHQTKSLIQKRCFHTNGGRNETEIGVNIYNAMVKAYYFV